MTTEVPARKRLAPRPRLTRQVMPAIALEVLDEYLAILRQAGFSEARAVEVLKAVVGYALGSSIADNSWQGPDPGPSEPDDELSRLRRVSDIVPRDASDHLLRLAVLFCGSRDLDPQFKLGIDLMIRGLEAEAITNGSGETCG